MKITLVGAGGGEVTGSCYIVETKQVRILVDCGLFQGGKKSEALNRPPMTPNRKLDAVVPHARTFGSYLPAAVARENGLHRPHLRNTSDVGHDRFDPARLRPTATRG